MLCRTALKGMVIGMYSIGDKVVHPMHGAGVIEDIKEIEMAGTKRRYYSVRFAVGSMMTNIPIDSCESIGIRDVVDKGEAKKLLEYFRDVPVKDDSNWNRRQRENIEKIKSGNIYKVLDVLKDLMYRERRVGLSTSERKTLGSARQIVLSELVLSNVAEISDIENILHDSIEVLV